MFNQDWFESSGEAHLWVSSNILSIFDPERQHIFEILCPHHGKASDLFWLQRAVSSLTCRMRSSVCKVEMN